MNRRNSQTRRRILPWRYALFLLLCFTAGPLLQLFLPWHAAIMAGFDIAAAAFLIAIAPLLAHDARRMRRHALENDVNRRTMLLVTSMVMLAILVAVAVELTQKQGPSMGTVLLIVTTLALAWLFSNMVYTLHYAHLFYLPGPGGKDSGGLDFPGGDGTPTYWDFIYFAFTLGMTFQTSDVEMTDTKMRQVATFHCLAAFIFNLGILAFTINVLGSMGAQ